MTCSHLWTPSLEPRTVVHSWYRHAMNEAAALEKEEEELNAELLEIKNRCKRAPIPGAYRFKHGEGYSDEELMVGEAPDEDSEYDAEEEDDEEEDEDGEDLDEEFDDEVEVGEEPEEEEGTVYSDAHGFEDDDDDDPDLPALISESSNTPEESFSPPAETSVTSPMERHANDNAERTGSSILPAMSVETRSRNNEMGGSEDFTPRNNAGELNLVSGDNYDTEDMEELDNLLPSD